MSSEVKNLSIKALERLALDLYQDYKRAQRAFGQDLYALDDALLLDRIKNAPALSDILRERKHRLNRRFKFEPQSIARFVAVNDLLQRSLTKARKEAQRVQPRLEERIAAKDAFLTDFEYELQIQPYTGKEQGIYGLLEELTHQSSAHLCFSKISLLNDASGVEDMNWNNCDGLGGFSDDLASHHIGYSMHELYSHTFWSLPDILKISHVWIDVVIIRQHYCEI